MTEEERYRQTIAERTPRMVLINARRLLAHKHKQTANWALAMHLYGLGSTYASRLCREACLNPDATE